MLKYSFYFFFYGKIMKKKRDLFIASYAQKIQLESHPLIKEDFNF